MVIEYKENDKMNFKVYEKDFITFLGNKNKSIVENLMFLKENNYITINNININNSNIYENRKYITFSSFKYLNTILGEIAKDELAFPLESLSMSKKEIKSKINEISKKFKLDYLDISIKHLSRTEIVKLSLASSLIINPKILVIDNILNLLDKDDYILVTNILKEFTNNGGVILNFTTNIEESLLGNKIIITDKEKIIVEGKTLSVLNEEKIMKRLGISLPFIIMLNKYLKDYDLINKYYLTYEELVGALWK